jgi:hypothetical protein
VEDFGHSDFLLISEFGIRKAGQLQPLAFSSAHRKILEHLGSNPKAENRNPKEIPKRDRTNLPTV